MNGKPPTITLPEIPALLSSEFKGRDRITGYVGSNAAAPTACLQALTAGIEAREPALPFIRMVHLLLAGPVPYVREGLQDRIMTYSIFSGGDVRDAANVGRAYYLPCSLAHVHTLLDKGRPYEPDFVLIKVRRNPQTGEYSLGLSVEALHTAIDHARIVIAELDDSMPFTQGQSVVDASSIDYLVEDDILPVYVFPEPDFDQIPAAERRIGELITQHFVRNGATLQVGIGKITDAIVATIRDAKCKHLGVQTELYCDGLMHLQEVGIVTNRRKKIDMGYSTTSLIMGSQRLYDYCHMRTSIQMRHCAHTNAMTTIQANAPFLAINTAMGVDLFGNVWTDFVDIHRYYSGVGGQPDFIRALNDPRHGTPIIALKSTTAKGDPKIAMVHPPGVSLTASSYDSAVIVTEYGIADLRGLTSGEKAVAIANIAHPKDRDTYLRHIANDPLFTKGKSFSRTRRPTGVIEYTGATPLKD